MPVVLIRYLSCLLIVSLYKLGLHEQARSLLPHYEGLYDVPEMQLNILPNERHFLNWTKIILIADDDFYSLVRQTREMQNSIDLLGLQKSFLIPYVLELVLERILAAVTCANDAAMRVVNTLGQVYVLQHRGELYGTCSSV